MGFLAVTAIDISIYNMKISKGRGYDTKVMRKLINIRKRNRDDIAEEEAVLEMYMSALGMA